MVYEHGCTRLSGASLCYSLDNNAGNGPGSPESRPINKLSSVEPLLPEEVVSGPAPQLSNIDADTGDVSDVVRDATDQHTSDEEIAKGPDDGAAFCAIMFKPAPAPILQRPDSPPPPPPTSSRGHTRGRKWVMVATRSSTRLAARPSMVPVAQHAQNKLMRELEFINTPSRALDDAITDYIDKFGQDLPVQAIKAIRAATRLENKELSKVLAAMAAESGAVEMEVT
jgi:hypothetical protein